MNSLAPGDPLPALKIEPISRRTLAMFAGASGDHQPVHIDIDEAKRRGREDVFAHGMLSMAYAGRFLTEWSPQVRLRSFRARFTAITPVHSSPTVTGSVTEIQNGAATIELQLLLEDGTRTLIGSAVVDLN